MITRNIFTGCLAIVLSGYSVTSAKAQFNIFGGSESSHGHSHGSHEPDYGGGHIDWGKIGIGIGTEILRNNSGHRHPGWNNGGWDNNWNNGGRVYRPQPPRQRVRPQPPRPQRNAAPPKKPATPDRNASDFAKGATYISRWEAQKVGDEATRAADEKVSEIKSQLDREIDEYVRTLLAGSGLADTEIEQIADALRRGDLNGARMILSQRPGFPGTVEILNRASDIAQLSSDLIAALGDIRQGKPATQIRPYFDRISQLLLRIGGPNYSTALIVQIRDLLIIRDIVITAASAPTPAPPGSFFPLPGGFVQIVYTPVLLPGRIVLVGSDLVCVGTGGSQTITCQGTIADAMGLPSSLEQPVPEVEKSTVYDGILIRNPEENEVAVNYTLDSHSFACNAGYHQHLRTGDSYVIRFDRGVSDEIAVAKYQLRPGTYTFQLTDGGWQLIASRYEVTIDNSKGDQSFHYVVNTKSYTVPAGRSRTHTGDYPLLFVFDDGGDGEDAKRMIHESGVYSFAVNAAENRWDLFPMSAVSEVAPSEPVYAQLPRLLSPALGFSGDDSTVIATRGINEGK